MEDKNYKNGVAGLSDDELDQVSGGKNRNYYVYKSHGIIVEDHWYGDKCFIKTPSGGKGKQISKSAADAIVESDVYLHDGSDPGIFRNDYCSLVE